MSDFERRLRDALAAEAESAGDTGGLAAGARSRLRQRRRRGTTIGAMVAVLAVAVPVGLLAAEHDRPGGPDEDTVASVMESVRVTCGGPLGTRGFEPEASWRAATMDGGLPDVVDGTAVRAAFAKVARETPDDAPEAIQEQGANAPFVVLSSSDVGYVLHPGARRGATPEGAASYIVGIGRWTTSGPGEDAVVAILQRQEDGTLRMTSWGPCDLRVAIPEGRSPVGISAPPGRVDSDVTDPVVMVTERECVSGRDPRPFLGEPQVVADDERVLVTITSEALRAGATCQGNPSVPVTLHLDEPIGDRALLDGGTWPPTPIKVAPTDEAPGGWHTVEHEGVDIDVPAGWERLDTSACEFDVVRFGPEGADPCGFEDEGVAFYGSATFDPAFGPGLRADEDGGWSGYVHAGDQAVNGWFDDRETGLRVLGSARREGQEAPDLSAGFRTESYDGLSIDVPATWHEGHLSTWCLDESVPGWIERPGRAGEDVDCVKSSNGYGIRFGRGPTTEGPRFRQQHGHEYPDGSWAGVALAGDLPMDAPYVLVVAPSQGLAELIGGSLRVQ